MLISTDLQLADLHLTAQYLGLSSVLCLSFMGSTLPPNKTSCVLYLLPVFLFYSCSLSGNPGAPFLIKTFQMTYV